MDPIGTVRREEHEGGYSIWLRQDPGYPDNQMTDTEWTCVHSTAPGNISVRLGTRIEEIAPIVSAVFGTPAFTGEDVQVGDRVETIPSAVHWTDVPLHGRIVKIGTPHFDAPNFTVEFDEPQHVPDEKFPVTYTHWALRRIHFRLIEENES